LFSALSALMLASTHRWGPLMSEQVETRSASRVDAFVDAAFAFCMTLLVVAGGQLPQTLDDLTNALLRVPAFAVGFALLALFWWAHHAFRTLHRRDDGTSLLLSLIIVFVIMIYVYPLRLLGESTAYYISGRTLPGSPVVQTVGDMRVLYVVYGVGFIVLSALYILLYRHAARHAADPKIRHIAGTTAGHWFICGFVGLVSVLLAVFLPRDDPWSAGIPGMAYMLIPVLILPYMAIVNRPSRRPVPAEA